MVTAEQPKDDYFHLTSGSPQQSKYSGLSFDGIKVPVYYFGSQFPMKKFSFPGDFPVLEEEESILDSLLLAQWEDRMFKGHVKYDVTASEIKVICGRRKFIAQLNEGLNIPHQPNFEKENLCQMNQVLPDWLKDHDKLLFCVASGEKANSELISSAAVPSSAILTIINATPVEYGHIFLLPCGSHNTFPFLDVGSLDMLTRVAVDVNNCSFRLFYDHHISSASFIYFQGWYFSNPLSVELMPVVSFYNDGLRGIRISSVIDYPIKTLLFESSHDMKLMVRIVAELCHGLQEKNIQYNLLVTDCAKKIFLFIQMPNSSGSSISAWECGGYFLFKSKSEFDQATEDAMLKHLSTISLSDSGFQAVKQLCCSIARKNQ